MAYVRKTRDEYEIHTNYGYGWECELCEDSLREAKQRVREYRDNARGLQGIFIKKHRVPIAEKA